MNANEKWVIRGSTIAHVVTDNESDIWRGEAMSFCGLLLVKKYDHPVSDDTKLKTCEKCERVRDRKKCAGTVVVRVAGCTPPSTHRRPCKKWAVPGSDFCKAHEENT